MYLNRGKALIKFHKVDLSWALDNVKYEFSTYHLLQVMSQGNLTDNLLGTECLVLIIKY